MNYEYEGKLASQAQGVTAPASPKDLQTLCNEIEALSNYAQRKLDHIDALMFGVPEAEPTDSSDKPYLNPAVAHTLQRSRDKLQNLTIHLERIDRALSASNDAAVAGSASGASIR